MIPQQRAMPSMMMKQQAMPMMMQQAVPQMDMFSNSIPTIGFSGANFIQTSAYLPHGGTVNGF